MQILPSVSSKYGAPMGRPESAIHDLDLPIAFEIDRVFLDEGYDLGGAYWGVGAPLWQAEGRQDEGAVTQFLRAPDIIACRKYLHTTYPTAIFTPPAFELCPEGERTRFIQAYAYAAVSTAREDLFLPKFCREVGYGFLAPSAWQEMTDKCNIFLSIPGARDALIGACELGYCESQAGYDFFTTQIRLGVGFLDRDFHGLENLLAETARRFPEEVFLELHDDGLIYIG